MNDNDERLICPNCAYHFHPSKLLYTSRSPDDYADDDLLGNSVPRRYKQEEIRTRGKYVFGPKGNPLVERACPYCHLLIPRGLLMRKPFLVSIVGASGAGKTYFLASMIYTLQRQLATSLGYALRSADTDDGRLLQENINLLFRPADPSVPVTIKKTEEVGAGYHTITISGQPVKLVKPFIFSIKPVWQPDDVQVSDSKQGLHLVLYDNAGESFFRGKDDTISDSSTLHLKRSAKYGAIIFLIDPLQEPAIRRDLMGLSDDPQLQNNVLTASQEEVLEEMIHRIRRQNAIDESSTLECDLLVCVQKCDVWEPLLKHELDKTSIHCDNGNAGLLNISGMGKNSLLVREFLVRYIPSIVATAEASFQGVHYFAVSAIGTSPEHVVSEGAAWLQDNLRVRPDKIRPFRISDPLLWILYSQRLLNAATPTRTEQIPTALPMGRSMNRIRVCSPFTKSHLTLHIEFAGKLLEDPDCGEWMAVPELMAFESNQLVKSANQISQSSADSGGVLGTFKRLIGKQKK